MSRPLARLVDIGLVQREQPFGKHPRRKAHPRQDRRSVLPLLVPLRRSHRSLLEARQLDVQTRTAWLLHLAESWEEIVRASNPGISIDDARWQPAQPWWGGAAAGPDAEIDAIAAHRDDRTRLLVGQVKLSLDAADVPRLLHDLEAKARACDWARHKQLTLRLWTLRWQGRGRRPPSVIDARELQASWCGATGRIHA